MGEIIPFPVLKIPFPILSKLVLESLGHMSIILLKNFLEIDK